MPNHPDGGVPDPAGTRWVIDTEVASVDSADRVAMIRPDRPDTPPLILEGSGAAIWDCLRRDVATSTTELADDLDIPIDAVESFLSQLADLGFVQRT